MNNDLNNMAGVKIAPPNENPINASTQQTAPVQQQVPSQVPLQQATIPAPQLTPQISNQNNNIQQNINTSNIQANQQNNTQPIINLPKEKKKKNTLIPILLLIILIISGYTVYASKNYQNTISIIKNKCSPVKEGKETKLDINSELVQELYKKVATNIREDIANPEFNNNMKIYLAYRQILERDKYDSNCNLFDINSMEPFTCEESSTFIPKAIKEKTIKSKLIELFGEENNIPLQNIQLGTSCIVGYQYIEKRGEFVEGYCSSQITNSFEVTKKIISATTTQTNIIIKEDVKYHEGEKLSLPKTLKSGIYTYVFQLDHNYHYILKEKTYKSKY